MGEQAQQESRVLREDDFYGFQSRSYLGANARSASILSAPRFLPRLMMGIAAEQLERMRQQMHDGSERFHRTLRIARQIHDERVSHGAANRAAQRRVGSFLQSLSP